MDNVTVRMQLLGRWEFSGDVTMTQAEFDRYEKMLDAGSRDYGRAMSELMCYVRFSRVDFDDADECDDFRIVKEPTP